MDTEFIELDLRRPMRVGGAAQVSPTKLLLTVTTGSEQPGYTGALQVSLDGTRFVPGSSLVTDRASTDPTIWAALEAENASLRAEVREIAVKLADAENRISAIEQGAVVEGEKTERSPVDTVVESLTRGEVSRPDKQRLRGALDKADAPATGRAASDQALGRIAGKSW